MDTGRKYRNLDRVLQALAVMAVVAVAAQVLPLRLPFASATPSLELPLSCGDSGWFGGTASGHRPNHYAIDFNKADRSDAGKPVLASGSGTVVLNSYSSSSNPVAIDHDGQGAHKGWTTLYLHMNPLAVRHGEQVKKGQVLGFVSDVGSPGQVHLHYEQRLNWNVQPARFTNWTPTYGASMYRSLGDPVPASTNCGGTSGGSATPTPSPVRPGNPTITLAQGGAARSGYWYSVNMSGFAPGSRVTLYCNDSADLRFFSKTFTINGAGQAADPTLCFSPDGPDHWVTSSAGVESNRVRWGRGATQNPPPLTVAPPPPTPDIVVAPPPLTPDISVAPLPPQPDISVTPLPPTPDISVVPDVVVTPPPPVPDVAVAPEVEVTPPPVVPEVSVARTSPVPAINPQLSLSRGAGAPSGYWYAVSLSGFAPGSTVTLTCRDSADPQGFYSKAVSVDGAGNASEARLCYSGDGPNHWVTASGGVFSNQVTWGGTPATTPTTVPVAVPRISLSRGASAPSGYWYAVSLSGFAPGSTVTLTCRDSADPQGFYTRSVTVDGAGNGNEGRLCYSGDGPNHWVTASTGATSNQVAW